MDKDKALEAAVTQIERQFGKGSVMRLGDHPISDDMQFVPTGSLAYASAGHPSGYLLDSGGKTKAELPATGRPLGLFPESTYETRSDLRLEAGDTLVLLTDGVTDCGDPERELFGAERALEMLRASPPARSSDVVEGLYRAVRAFEAGEPQRDDVTALVVKRLPRE